MCKIQIRNISTKGLNTWSLRLNFLCDNLQFILSWALRAMRFKLMNLWWFLTFGSVALRLFEWWYDRSLLHVFYENRVWGFCWLVNIDVRSWSLLVFCWIIITAVTAVMTLFALLINVWMLADGLGFFYVKINLLKLLRTRFVIVICSIMI